MSVHDRLNSLPVVQPNLNKEKSELVSTVEKTQNPVLKTKAKESKSRYEIDKDTKFTIRFGIYFESNGGVVIIPQDRIETLEESVKDIVIEKHWVTFRLWNYMESIDWRQESIEYNNSSRVFNVNQNKFNELKVRRLLLEWSFDEHKLFHINNQLTDESMSVIFYKLNPHIVKKIIDLMNEELGE